MNIHLYISDFIPLSLAETLATATREEIARSAQNGVEAGALQNMAEFLKSLEYNIHEAKAVEEEEDAE